MPARRRLNGLATLLVSVAYTSLKLRPAAFDRWIAEQQKKNRATWWDKPQDMETSKRRARAAVPQPGYVYFPLPRRAGDEEPDLGNKLSTPSRPA